MSGPEKPSGLGWRMNMVLASALLACVALVVLIGYLLDLDPRGDRLSFNYFCYTTVTAVVLWWGDIEAVLRRLPRWKGAALAAVIPGFFAVCLALSFGALAVAQAAVGLARRLLLPGVDPGAEWLLWPVLALAVLITAGAGVELRHRLDRSRTRPE